MVLYGNAKRSRLGNLIVGNRKICLIVTDDRIFSRGNVRNYLLRSPRFQRIDRVIVVGNVPVCRSFAAQRKILKSNITGIGYVQCNIRCLPAVSRNAQVSGRS